MKIKQWLIHLKKILGKENRSALNDLDRKLEKYINHRAGFFIEVGANDGYSQSNTYYLEKERGWRGVLIEGIPELYEKCKKTRRLSSVYNCALVADDYVGATIKMHYANLMSVTDGAFKAVAEQNEHLGKGIRVQRLDRSYVVEVPARTLGSILDEVQPPPVIDFFSLDVEGYELNVLKGLNLSQYKPRYILVEARFFDEVNTFLIEHDYELIEKLTHHDYLYRAKKPPCN